MFTFAAGFLALPIIIILIVIAYILLCIVAFRKGTSKGKGTPTSQNRTYGSYDGDYSYVEEQKRITGRLGEAQVSFILGNSRPGVRHTFNDVLLKLGDKTSQIDHILVNRAGVFVIETKKVAGTILGSQNSDKWTQYRKNGENTTFYNPIKQNNTHVKFVESIIGNKYPVLSLIVFANNNKPQIDSDEVVDWEDFRNTLIEKSSVTHLSSEEIDSVSALISKHICQDYDERQRHVQMAKQTKALLQEERCPRCKRKLVLKKGKFGEFWACSGHPDCKYTKSKK